MARAGVAAALGHLKTVKNGYVIPKYPEDDALEELRLEIVKGDAQPLQRALVKGLKADQALRGGWSALMYACSLGHREIARILLDNGANPNFSKDSFTPLMAACASSREEERQLACVKLLVARGAEVGAVDRFGVTPMMFAAREGHAAIVEYLLRKGADLRMRDQRGWTALFWAVNSERKAVIKVLLKAESDLYQGRVGDLEAEPKKWMEEVNAIDDKPLSNGILTKGDDEEDLRLAKELRAVAELEAAWRRQLATLGALRASVDAMAMDRPLPSGIRQGAGRRLALASHRALAAAEKLFRQARFLHSASAKVSEVEAVIPGDFVVETKRPPCQEPWASLILSTAIVAVSLWRSCGLPFPFPAMPQPFNKT